MLFKSSPVLLAALAGVANAQTQVPLYGQCGGSGWTGGTQCVAGSVCHVYNEWYSQCIPGTTSAPATTSSTSRIITSTTSSPPPAGTGTKYFISFGDSYSQTGFDINGQKPSAANPLGNPALPGWTASGGLDWVGFMVTEFNSSLTLSYNFAYGGATVDAALVPPYASTVLSFIDQVKLFSGSIASKPSYAPWTADNTVAGVWMGVNDIGNSFWLDGQADLQGKILARYFEQMQILYNAGVRKFVLLAVPPTDKTPAFLAQPDALTLLRTAIKAFNDLIATNLAKFTAANAGVTAKIVDTSLGFNEAINNPKKYGAADATCWNEDGHSCLWFNDYHPGVAIQRLVGAQVAKAWSGFFKCVDSVFC